MGMEDLVRVGFVAISLFTCIVLRCGMFKLCRCMKGVPVDKVDGWQQGEAPSGLDHAWLFVFGTGRK